MRIAVCDDDREFLRHTQAVLKRWEGRPDALTVELYEDGDALLKAHGTVPFDVVLLDVVMPLLSGIETARELRQQDKTVKLVFLTASPEFAVESYTVKASNYLLKPLDPEKLYACLEELAEELRAQERSITVKSANALHRVQIGSIEYIEAQNKHVLFTLADGHTLEAIEPLYTFEGKLLLSDGFFKCSRSYIVNIHRIVTFTQREVTMASGCRIPISRSCHKQFEEAYFSILFGKAGES